MFDARAELRAMVPEALERLRGLISSDNPKVALQAAKLVVEGAYSSTFSLSKCVSDELADSNAYAMALEKQRDWELQMGKRIPEAEIDERIAGDIEKITNFLLGAIGTIEYPAASGLAHNLAEVLYAGLFEEDKHLPASPESRRITGG